jgi:hypothetical protein
LAADPAHPRAEAMAAALDGLAEAECLGKAATGRVGNNLGARPVLNPKPRESDHA